MPFLPILAIMIITLVLMALALWFSKYKKRDSGCCGGIHCGDEKSHGCYGEKTAFVKKYSSLNKS